MLPITPDEDLKAFIRACCCAENTAEESSANDLFLQPLLSDCKDGSLDTSPLRRSGSQLCKGDCVRQSRRNPLHIGNHLRAFDLSPITKISLPRAHMPDWQHASTQWRVLSCGTLRTCCASSPPRFARDAPTLSSCGHNLTLRAESETCTHAHTRELFRPHIPIAGQIIELLAKSRDFIVARLQGDLELRPSTSTPVAASWKLKAANILDILSLALKIVSTFPSSPISVPSARSRCKVRVWF